MFIAIFIRVNPRNPRLEFQRKDEYFTRHFSVIRMNSFETQS